MLRFNNDHQVWYLTLAILMLLVLVTNSSATSTVQPSRSHRQHLRRLHQHESKTMTKAISREDYVTAISADPNPTSLQHSEHSLQKRDCLLWVAGICIWWWNQNAVTGSISSSSSSAVNAARSAALLAAVNATSTAVLNDAISGTNLILVSSATQAGSGTYVVSPTPTAPFMTTTMSTTSANSTLIS